MAFEYGFYNSINGDRKYNSLQISQIFDGVITDGVFASIGDKLFTTANGGMEIAVGTGKAWFNHTWNLNTTKMVFTLPHSHAVLSRYDAVVLEVNEEQNVYGRVNEIKIVYGTPSSNAIKPTMINTQYVHQHPLAYIKVNAAAEAITAADIEITVGQTSCPFVTSVLQQTDITGLFANWNQQFTTWFNNLKAQLTDNVVANLQNQINNCLKPTDIATAAQIKAGTAGKLVDAAGLKSNFQDMTYKVGDVIYTRQNMPVKYPGKWVRADGKLLYPNQYPQLRPLGWNRLDYVNRGDNINSKYNAYMVHTNVFLIFNSVLVHLFFLGNENNIAHILAQDRISDSYVKHTFSIPNLIASTCSGMGSCARYQDGKLMFVFWTGNGMWYVLECPATNNDVWNKNKWVLFSTASANTNIPRQNMDTMYRYGNSLFVYEQGGHVIKIDLDYTYKSLIVADAGLVNKNINLGSNVTVVRYPAEAIIHNGAYFLPVVASNNFVGLIEVAPATGLGIKHSLNSFAHAGRDLVRCFVRSKTDTRMLVEFLSAFGTNVSNGTYLALTEMAIDGPTGGLVWSITYDLRYDIADIPNETNKRLALAAYGIGGRNEGMIISTLFGDGNQMAVYSEYFKFVYVVRSLDRDSIVNGSFIVFTSYPLGFPITWPAYAYSQDGHIMRSPRPYNTIWLYGEVDNDFLLSTPYAIKETVPGTNGDTVEIGHKITYFPNYRLPLTNNLVSRDLGCLSFVKVAD